MTDKQINALRSVLTIQKSMMNQIPLTLRLMENQRTICELIIKSFSESINRIIDIKDVDDRTKELESFWTTLSSVGLHNNVEKILKEIEEWTTASLEVIDTHLAELES